MLWKIVRRHLQRAQRRKHLAQAWVNDLESVLAARDAPEAYASEVAKGTFRGQSARDEVRDSLRSEHLAPVRESHDSCGAVDGATEEVVVALVGRAGMQPAANGERHSRCRRWIGNGLLDRDGGVQAL